MPRQPADRKTVDDIAEAIAENLDGLSMDDHDDEAIAENLDGLSMDDHDDRLRMTEWIAQNFQPQPEPGREPERRPSGSFLKP